MQTDDEKTLSVGLVIRSVGYRATPPRSIPFDEVAGVASTVRNVDGVPKQVDLGCRITGSGELLGEASP